jgi:hypothetical protein
MSRACFLFAIVALAACRYDTTVSLESFDTTCSKDADCVPVQVGDICGCPDNNAAINGADLSAYQAEVLAKEPHCPPYDKCDAVVGSAACSHGRCAFVAP